MPLFSRLSLARSRHRSGTLCGRSPAVRPLGSRPSLEPLEGRVLLSSYGDPNNPGALPGQLQAGYAAGDRDLVINPGTYVLPANSSSIQLQNWHNATVSAYGVTSSTRR